MTHLGAFARWARDAALPYWSERGVDPDGGFYEALDFNGAPLPALVRRVRVTFRQIYVLSHAHKLGLIDAADLVDRGLARIEELAWAPNGAPGWAHRLEAGGSINDGSRDCYDHAFALFSLAWAKTVFDSPRAERLYRATLDVVIGSFRHKQGGFRENLDVPARLRRQNPHMHLVEAFLKIYELTGDATALREADDLILLFDDWFYRNGALLEWFEDDWSSAPEEVRAKLEPGHHVEWVWLLRARERLGGPDRSEACAALMRRALASRPAGFETLCDEMDLDGRETRSTRRLWVQTELLKGSLAQAQAGVSGATEEAARAAGAILNQYLAPATPGCWIDRLDAEGKNVAQNVPASTLYHLFSAAVEAGHFSGALEVSAA